MMGRTISAKPASSRMLTNRDSMRRRRAASSSSSGLTPVGYRNFFSTKQKPPPRKPERRSSQSLVCLAAPLRFGAHGSPLHHVMMVMVVGANDASCVHQRRKAYHGTL